MRHLRAAVPLVCLAALALTLPVTRPARAGNVAAELTTPAAAYSAAERPAPPSPPTPGNPGSVALPPHATLVDTSRPDIVIGSGSPAGCTSDAVVAAIAAGGIITFDCGPDPITITMTATAKVVNTSPIVVLDGGGKVTLDGVGQRRILYMNTCDRNQIWTTSHCQNQRQPELTIQRMTFTRGNSTGDTTVSGGGGGGDGGGGGAVFVRGGRVTVLDSAFTANRCDNYGPDVGGGAMRVLSQFEGRPVVVANSTFGGSVAAGNVCSNGGATSSIGVSWEIYNSVFSHNRAIGLGANPQRPGTPGGGNGGAIYLDGGLMTLDLAGSLVHDNTANEGGGGIFFVSNDRRGTMRVAHSVLERNESRGFETRGFPGIFVLAKDPPTVISSTIR